MNTTVDPLERVIEHGNRGYGSDWSRSKITCADGFNVSVIAGGGTYCSPRPALLPGIGRTTNEIEHDYAGPYTAVEVGFPSERPEPWSEWSEYAEATDAPTETVYGYVPVDMVRALIASHGGPADA